jgi:hypothetical protein
MRDRTLYQSQMCIFQYMEEGPFYKVRYIYLKSAILWALKPFSSEKAQSLSENIKVATS